MNTKSVRCLFFLPVQKNFCAPVSKNKKENKKLHRPAASFRFLVGKKIDETNRCWVGVGGLGENLRQVLFRAAAFAVAAPSHRVAVSGDEHATVCVRPGFDGREVRSLCRLLTRRTSARAVDARTKPAVFTLLERRLPGLFRGIGLRDGQIGHRFYTVEEHS